MPTMSAMPRPAGPSLVPLFALCALVIALVAFFVRGSRPGSEYPAPPVDHSSQSLPTPELIDADTPVESARQAEPQIPAAAIAPDAGSAPSATASLAGEGQLIVHVVHAESGRPFVGARVLLERGRFFAGIPTEAWTNVSGNAEFTNLPWANWTIVVHSEGVRANPIQCVLEPLNPSQHVEVRLVEEQVMTVRLVDDSGREFGIGHSESDLVVLANTGIQIAAACGAIGGRIERGDGSQYQSRWTGSDRGPFRWNVSLARAESACAHAVMGDWILGTAPFDASMDEVDVRIGADVLRRANQPLRVRVVFDVGDGPAIGARVRFGVRHGTAHEHPVDAEGRVQSAELPMSDIDISVSLLGFVSEARRALRPFDDEVLVRLKTGHRIAGTLSDQRGEPMPRAVVRLFTDTLTGAAAMQLETVTTDADGEFEFAAVRPGLYAISLGAHDGTARIPSANLRGGPNDNQMIVYADCRLGDVSGLALRGYRAVNDVNGEAWNPPVQPRK